MPSFVYVIAMVSVSISYFKLARHLSRQATFVIATVANPQQTQVLQSRRIRVAKMVLLLVLLFFLCATPANVYDAFLFFKPTKVDSRIRYATKFLVFFHSTVNPVAVFVLSGAHRKAFMELQGMIRGFHWHQFKNQYIERRPEPVYRRVQVAVKPGDQNGIHLIPHRGLNPDSADKNVTGSFSEKKRRISRSLTLGADLDMYFDQSLKSTYRQNNAVRRRSDSHIATTSNHFKIRSYQRKSIFCFKNHF